MTVASAPHSVLIIDHDEAFRSLLATSLVKRGHVAARASRARDALETLQRRRFDLVVVDAFLPDNQFGLKLLAEVRTRHSGPVVFVSAYFQDAKAQAELITEHRVVRSIAKPVAADELLSQLEAVLARPEAMATLPRPVPAGTPAAVPERSLEARLEALKVLVQKAETTRAVAHLQAAHRQARELREAAGKAGAVALEVKVDRVEGLLDTALQLRPDAIRWTQILAAFAETPPTPVRIGGLPGPQAASRK